MKLLILAMALILSSPAFASNPLAGTWYIPFSQNGNDFNPESLVQISDDGVMTTARIFPKSSQKVVTKAQIAVTASTLQFVKVLPSMTCPDLHDQTPEGATVNYQVVGDELDLLMNGTPIAKMVKASPEEIQKFASTVEGCN